MINKISSSYQMFFKIPAESAVPPVCGKYSEVIKTNEVMKMNGVMKKC
jgi:hypothetical protein